MFCGRSDVYLDRLSWTAGQSPLTPFRSLDLSLDIVDHDTHPVTTQRWFIAGPMSFFLVQRLTNNGLETGAYWINFIVPEVLKYAFTRNVWDMILHWPNKSFSDSILTMYGRQIFYIYFNYVITPRKWKFSNSSLLSLTRYCLEYFTDIFTFNVVHA